MSEREPVLIVGDVGTSRGVLQAHLRAHGQRLVSTRTGREALAYLLGGERPSMILADLDAAMPDREAFLARQRRDPRLLYIPLVIVSQAREVAMARGADAWLERPIHPDRLLALVFQYARRSHPVLPALTDRPTQASSSHS